MNSLQILLQEQRAISLVVALGWSLALALSIGKLARQTDDVRMLKRATWLAHALLGGSGAAMVFMPSHGFAALGFAIVAGLLLLLKMRRAIGRRTSSLA
jgi:hypothetical protein